MEELSQGRAKVEIRLSARGTGQVLINGVDVSNITKRLVIIGDPSRGLSSVECTFEGCEITGIFESAIVNAREA